jgi:hypothetical protein
VPRLYINLVSKVSYGSPMYGKDTGSYSILLLNSSSSVQFSVAVSQRDQRLKLFQSHLHLFVAGNLPSNVVLLREG